MHSIKYFTIQSFWIVKYFTVPVNENDTVLSQTVPSILKIRFPSDPAMVDSAASSETLKKYLLLGTLAMDLISAIRFVVSMLFLE